VTGPVDLPDPAGVAVVRVTGALEMRAAVRRAFPRCDALVMTAAVSDYRPARRRPGKWRKGPGRLSLSLVRTPDILAECGRRKGRRVLVGFAVEVQGALSGARRKLRGKRLDALCLCSPAAFGADRADYRILVPGRNPLERRGIRKAALAREIVFLAERPRPPAGRPRRAAGSAPAR